MKVHFIKHRRIWYAISTVLIAGSLIFMMIFGLRFGIDFTGGSLLSVRFDQTIESTDLRSTLEAAGFTEVSFQDTEQNGFLLRTKNLTEEEHQKILEALQTLGVVEERQFDSIGPVVGNELRKTAMLGVLITLVLIGLYIAWAFRKVTSSVESWKYGVITILCSIHDIVVTVGFIALFGYLFNWEIGTAFVAAILTILGYSINDTVILFDRTRENLIRQAEEHFEETVELSIHQTLTRSLSTSLTTILALLAVFLFGGESTRPFALVLIIGIAVGTYSSIFFASPLLVSWNLWKKHSNQT